MSDLQERVDRAINTAVSEGRIVGATILVAVDGTTVYRGIKGFMDREAAVPMRADAIFRLASVTKPMVAATALALVERGQMDLVDPVTRWLPDFRPALPDGRAAVITIHHLLTHTAGFGYPSPEPGDPYVAEGISDGLNMPGRGMEENLRRLARARLFHEPGTAWRYGMSIDVLGAIIAKVHSGTLAAAVAHYVTGPLAMTDTDFRVVDTSRLAVPYGDAKPRAVRMGEPHMTPVGPFSPARILDETSFQSGGVGMAGTAGDFLKFLEAVRTGDPPILKPGTLAMATRNQIGDLPREEKDAGWRFGYLSAVLADPVAAGAPHAAGTLRWGGTWGHNWFIDPARRMSVAAFTNTAMEGCNGPFTVEVRDAIYGQRK